MAHAILRAATRLFSPRDTLSILIFHRVLARPDSFNPDEIDAAVFERQIQTLASCYTVLPLHDAVDALLANRLPPRAAAVTFDDGYADNAEVALPILQRHGVHATFFVASAYLDGGVMWNDKIIECIRHCESEALDLNPLGLGTLQLDQGTQRWQVAMALIRRLKYLEPAPREQTVDAICRATHAEPPKNLMMTTNALRALASSGMEIGGHTVSHPILASLDPADAEREIADNRSALEQITGQAIRLFAYPNGKPEQDYRRDHVEMVRRLGFKAAVSTAWGVAHSGSDPYQLPRFTPWDTQPTKFALRLLQNQTRRNPAVV